MRGKTRNSATYHGANEQQRGWGSQAAVPASSPWQWQISHWLLLQGQQQGCCYFLGGLVGQGKNHIAACTNMSRLWASMWTGRKGRDMLLEEMLPGEFSLFVCGSDLSTCLRQLLTARLRKAEVQRDGVDTGGLSSCEQQEAFCTPNRACLGPAVIRVSAAWTACSKLVGKKSCSCSYTSKLLISIDLPIKVLNSIKHICSPTQHPRMGLVHSRAPITALAAPLDQPHNIR